MQAALGPSICYVSTFLDITPPPSLCKQKYSTKIKQKLSFSDPLPPYVSKNVVLMYLLKVSKNVLFMNPLPPKRDYVIYEWYLIIIDPKLLGI